MSEIGLARARRADLRFLETLEWNLIGNREGWGKTNTYEWTDTKCRRAGYSYRLITGRSDYGGAGEVYMHGPDDSDDRVGFRAAVVLG